MAIRRAFLIFGSLILSAPVLGQASTATLVDLATNTAAFHFFVGNNPTAVAWAGNAVAYIVNDDGNTLVRLDMTASPPVVTATYTFPAGFDPHGLAINPAGTRALVSGDTNSVYLLDLTSAPISVADTIAVPVIDAGGVAFYAAGSRGIIVDEDSVLFLDLSVIPAAVTTVSLGGNQGLAVAVNPAGTRAVVTIDLGGLQTIDLTATPPTLIGTPVGSLAADSLGVAVSPDGTRAIYVDESLPAPEANVVDISATPTLLNTVPISLNSPSAVAFNPVSTAVLIAADDGVAFLNSPYTAVSETFTDPGNTGATTYSIAVNPAGTFAIVLNEDQPSGATPTPTPAGGPTPTPTPPVGPTAVVPTLSFPILVVFALALAIVAVLLIGRR